ncbi:MAG: YbaB/EbfC family nucleoid-associated protein [Alphaproteobacteria bacterium]
MNPFKNVMQQAQVLQAQMAEVQKKLDHLEVEGASGGGLVSVKFKGKGEVKSVSVDDSLLIASEKEILEDLLVAAFNDARMKAEALASSEMAKVTGDLKLPGGLKLPF